MMARSPGQGKRLGPALAPRLPPSRSPMACQVSAAAGEHSDRRLTLPRPATSKSGHDQPIEACHGRSALRSESGLSRTGASAETGGTPVLGRGALLQLGAAGWRHPVFIGSFHQTQAATREEHLVSRTRSRQTSAAIRILARATSIMPIRPNTTARPCSPELTAPPAAAPSSRPQPRVPLPVPRPYTHTSSTRRRAQLCQAGSKASSCATAAQSSSNLSWQSHQARVDK